MGYALLLDMAKNISVIKTFAQYTRSVYILFGEIDFSNPLCILYAYHMYCLRVCRLKIPNNNIIIYYVLLSATLPWANDYRIEWHEISALLVFH